MCRIVKFIFYCGHPSGEQVYVPVDVNDCSQAVRRENVYFLPLDRCYTMDTADSSIPGYCIGNDRCREIAFGRAGWTCCQCKCLNSGRYMTCQVCKHHHACDKCDLSV